MKLFRILPFVFIISLASCAKTYDFSENLRLTVKEFLKSKNCDVPCYEIPEIEGEFVKLVGSLDQMNYFPDQHRFFFEDIEDSDYSVEIQVDTIISQIVFQKIDDMQVNNLVIGGIISSFDKPTNLSCSKGYILTIVDAQEIVAHYLPD